MSGIIFAIIIAFLLIARVPVLSQIFKVYISFMRGTPIIIQMFLVYYGLPNLVLTISGVNINRMDKVGFVIIAFILNMAAFLAEDFRGAILSIPAGQTEAGYSIGLTKIQTFRRIVLPQAFRIMIPLLGSESVGLLNSCSIAFFIGAMEVVGAAKAYGVRTKHQIEAYCVAACMFIVLSLLIRAFFKLLEMRFFRIKGKEV